MKTTDDITFPVNWEFCIGPLGTKQDGDSLTLVEFFIKLFGYIIFKDLNKYVLTNSIILFII